MDRNIAAAIYFHISYMSENNLAPPNTAQEGLEWYDALRTLVLADVYM